MHEDKLDKTREPVEFYNEIMGSKKTVMILIMLPETIVIKPEYTLSYENEIVNFVEIPP